MVLAIVAFASAWNAQPTVASSNSLSIAELQEAIAGLEARIAALVPLEARVAALEGKLRHYEAQEAREPREPNTTRPLLVSLTENHVERAPMRVAPLALSAPKEEPKSWSGLYWGTSFGYGGTSLAQGTTINSEAKTPTPRCGPRGLGTTKALSNRTSISAPQFSSKSRPPRGEAKARIGIVVLLPISIWERPFI